MSDTKLIPAKIHFFHNSDFFANSERYRNTHESLDSWKKYLPSCEIKLWHENLPEFQMMLSHSRYLRECYRYKLWAMVADYVRAWVLYEYGGIYLDTDLVLLQNVEHLRESEFFTFAVKAPTVRILDDQGLLPSCHDYALEPAFLGGVSGHKIFAQVLKIYNSNELFCSEFWIANCLYTLGVVRAYHETEIDFIPCGQYLDYHRSFKKKKCASQDLPASLYVSSAALESQEGILLLPDGAKIYGPKFMAQGLSVDQVAKTKDLKCYAWHKCYHSWGSFVAKYFMRYKQHGLFVYKVMMLYAQCVGGILVILKRIKGLFKKRQY